ncbi:MAG: hypothetical protein K8S62_05770 [Candidatus Sabulitectum sp.]|nr:hypothetical protein [Candidatus Sabulitectum sp.]
MGRANVLLLTRIHHKYSTAIREHHVKALEELIINEEEICVCGVILTEVLCIVIR